MSELLARRSVRALAAAGLGVFYLALVLHSSPHLSPAFDEPIHVRAGLSLLTHGQYVDVEKAWWTILDPLTPPMDMLPGALAWSAGQTPDYRESNKTEFAAIRRARWANHAFGLGILAIVLLWGARLWGFWAGWIGAAALAMQPLFIAHSTIVSTDLYMAFGGLLAAYCIWTIYLRPRDETARPTNKWAMHGFAGLAVAFAIACKVSNVVFLPVLIAAIYFMEWRSLAEPENKKRALHAGLGSALAVFVALAVAAVIYGSTRVDLGPLDIAGYRFRLPFAHTLARAIATATTLDQVRPPIFYRGYFQTGVPKHYIAGYVFKTQPALLALQALGLAGATALALRGAGRRAIIFLAALVAVLAALFSTRGVYLGLRHMLLPIVFVSILTGGAIELARIRDRASRTAFIVVAALCLLVSGIELIRAAPWHLSYFNAFGRDRLILVGPDGDWGEGLVALRTWRDEFSPGEPLWLAYFGNNTPEDFDVEYRGLRAPFSFQRFDDVEDLARDPGAIKGWVAISATQLAGTFMPSVHQPRTYYERWRAIEPDFIVGGSIYIFDRR